MYRLHWMYRIFGAEGFAIVKVFMYTSHETYQLVSRLRREEGERERGMREQKAKVY